LLSPILAMCNEGGAYGAVAFLQPGIQESDARRLYGASSLSGWGYGVMGRGITMRFWKPPPGSER